MSTQLRGKLALVTGGASGIGKALAEELTARGCDVVLADRQADLVRAVARDLDGKGGAHAFAEALDVRDLAAFEAVVRRTLSRGEKVDFFFNNAGIGVGGEMRDYEAADWDDVLDVNLRGVCYGVQAVYPAMVARRSGHIINTASVAGLVPAGGAGSYTATKYAVVGLSKALRVEAAAYGVRVSALCPGAIRTPILTGGAFGRLNYRNLTAKDMLGIWEQVRPMDPAVFARKVIDAVLRDEPVIIVPSWWKALWYLERFAPSLSTRLFRARMDKLRAQLAALGVEPARAEPAADAPARADAVGQA